MCAVRAKGSASEVLHPQEPLPVPGVVHCDFLLLRVPHVLPHYAQHSVSGNASKHKRAKKKKKTFVSLMSWGICMQHGGGNFGPFHQNIYLVFSFRENED